MRANKRGKRQLIRTMLLLATLTGALSACVHSVSQDAVPDTQHPLRWLTGCWQTGDNAVEETWVLSRQGDQLFGYSVTSNNGVRVFFEMMRIDIEDSGTTYTAYPGGTGGTAFTGAEQRQSLIEFVNAENDYPQRIRYSRVDNRLMADISLLDRSRPAQWEYHPCAKDGSNE